MFNEPKRLPKSLVIGIGIFMGTTEFEVPHSIASIVAILIYVVFVFMVYYAFFEAKYCLENELVYIYKGQEIDKYRFKDIG